MQLNTKGPNEPPIYFEPSWDGSKRLIWELVAAAQSGELSPTLDAIARGQHRSSGDLKVRFAVSLLRDILRAGGVAWVRDSKLLVQWPSWDGAQGKDFAQRALMAARDMRPLTPTELSRVAPLFAPDLDGEQMAEVLREAKFDLESASGSHPTGIPYNEAFGAALRNWTMPYRGRTGRMRRFVLLATHRHLGPHPVIAAILELGDEAPFCTWRDDLLGLSNAAFSRWLNTESIKQTAEAIADHLGRIRACLLPTREGWDISAVSADSLVSDKNRLEEASHGRSLVEENEREALKDRKRLAHGLRLARGELALRKIAHGAALDPSDSDLGAGVRVIHDLVIPRVHLEATVCGALPPFSDTLGGKLITAFFSHPEVIRSVSQAESELLGWSFDLERLLPQIPSHGLLCLTTKGLYSGHAAIYNRAEAPGINGPIRLKHLANTAGITTSLVSTETTVLAKKLLSDPSIDSRKISTVYGSGGAKRHRAIEAATRAVGLPSRLALAGIRRPVYGLSFVRNAAEVIWLGNSPDWLVPISMSARDFSDLAVEQWRARWLDRAISRAQEYALMPSLVRGLLADTPMVKQ